MIRRLEKSDIDRIMDIWINTTIKAHSFVKEEYWMENYDIVKNIYLPSSDTYIYEDDEDIKGFISVVDNEFIGALFIDYKYQGYGIGKKLIDYISSIYTKLTLTVYKDNYRAVQFYKQIGFKVIDEMCNEDTKCIEYLMKK